MLWSDDKRVARSEKDEFVIIGCLRDRDTGNPVGGRYVCIANQPLCGSPMQKTQQLLLLASTAGDTYT